MPAPRNNSNRMTHGQRSDVGMRLVLGLVPSGFEEPYKQANRFRRMLEDAVGEIDIQAAIHIQSATRNECLALMAWSAIRQDWHNMKYEQRSNLMDRISKCTDARDRAVKALDLRGSKATSLADAIRENLRSHSINVEPIETTSTTTEPPCNGDAAESHTEPTGA